MEKSNTVLVQYVSLQQLMDGEQPIITCNWFVEDLLVALESAGIKPTSEILIQAMDKMSQSFLNCLIPYAQDIMIELMVDLTNEKKEVQ